MHPVIKASKVERTIHPDGRVDINVHVPILKLVNAVGIEKARKITGLPIPSPAS